MLLYYKYIIYLDLVSKFDNRLTYNEKLKTMLTTEEIETPQKR